MKRIGNGIRLFVLLTFVAITAACTKAESEANIQELLPPPDRPPDVYILNSGSPQQLQKGIITISEWTVDGQLVKNSPGLPTERPDPLPFSSSDEIIVRIANVSAPFEMEIRQFGSLDPEIGYRAKPMSVTEWYNPRAFSHHANDPVRLTFNSDSEIPGWDLRVRVPPSSNVSYMNIYAVWHDIPRPGSLLNNRYSANWAVSAQRVVSGTQ